MHPIVPGRVVPSRLPRRTPRLARAAILSLGILLLCFPETARAATWEEAKQAFEAGVKDADWKERKDAYVRISEHDRPEAVAEVLQALGRETNPAVALAAVDALASYRSDASRKVMVDAARKAGGESRLLLLLALEKQGGPGVDALLLDLAKGTDPRAAALAARALGAKSREGAVPLLTTLLKDGDWQVRAAAAQSLGRLQAKDAVPALAAALDLARGRDRRDLVETLQSLTGQDLGNDAAAWKAFAAGTDVAAIKRKPDPVPRIFGVPIYGQRVVVCLDNSLRMSDPHPFDKDRLMDLCDPKDGGKAINWFRMMTMGHFAHGHVRHLVEELPKGSKIEILTFNAAVRAVLGKFAPVGAATKKVVEETLEGLTTDDGIASYEVLSQALDTPAAAAAWKSGPDEVVFITVNMPTSGEIREADAVAAAIALKARLRGVPVHTVGIGLHPYDMCRVLAERTGGTYVDLTK